MPVTNTTATNNRSPKSWLYQGVVLALIATILSITVYFGGFFFEQHQVNKDVNNRLTQLEENARTYMQACPPDCTKAAMLYSKCVEIAAEEGMSTVRYLQMIEDCQKACEDQYLNPVVDELTSSPELPSSGHLPDLNQLSTLEVEYTTITIIVSSDYVDADFYIDKIPVSAGGSLQYKDFKVPVKGNGEYYLIEADNGSRTCKISIPVSDSPIKQAMPCK